jgi:hypothetical protein
LATVIGLAAFGVAFGLEPTLTWVLRMALAGVGLTMAAIAALVVLDILRRTGSAS